MHQVDPIGSVHIMFVIRVHKVIYMSNPVFYSLF